MAEESQSHPMKDLLSKEMQIMHLGQKIKFYAKEAEAVQVKYADLEKEYKDYKHHQTDITTFLNEKLDDQYNKIDELEHLVVNLRLEKKNFGTDMETKFIDETGALQDQLSQANLKIDQLESELSSLNTFKTRKEEVENHVTRLEEELALVKQETQQQLLQLDRQHIRQKEQMASQIKERVAETEKVTWNKWQSMYDDNTMKAMKRNRDMTIELKYQSRAAEKLMGANKQLQQKYKDALQEIKVYKNMQEEFGKSMQAYKRQIKQLVEKLRRYEEDPFINVTPGNSDGSRRARGASGSSTSSNRSMNNSARSSPAAPKSRKKGSTSVVNLSLRGGRARGSSGSSSRGSDAALVAAQDEIARLREQVAKYRAKSRQLGDEAAAAKRSLANHTANVDFLGSFLLTAMEDIRKRKSKLAKVPLTKPLPRDGRTSDIEIPDMPYIQLPLQSREELVGEFITHVRSLKLQVAAGRGSNNHRESSHLASTVGKLPSIEDPNSISAPEGNTKGTQCSLGSGGGDGFWTDGSRSSLPSTRENLGSRAFITSAQPEHGGKMKGQGLSMSRDASYRPYTLH